MLLILKVTAALWIISFVLIPNAILVLKGVRDARRRRAVRREVGRTSVAGYRDPAWPRVSVRRPPVRDAGVARDRTAVARVLAVRSPQPWLAVVDRGAEADLSHVLSYGRESEGD